MTAHLCMYVPVGVCIHKCLFVHVCVFMCISIYVCMVVCTRVTVYVCDGV